jgi:hypothetical protein
LHLPGLPRLISILIIDDGVADVLGDFFLEQLVKLSAFLFIIIRLLKYEWRVQLYLTSLQPLNVLLEFFQIFSGCYLG